MGAWRCGWHAQGDGNSSFFALCKVVLHYSGLPVTALSSQNCLQAAGGRLLLVQRWLMAHCSLHYGWSFPFAGWAQTPQVGMVCITSDQPNSRDVPVPDSNWSAQMNR